MIPIGSVGVCSVAQLRCTFEPLPPLHDPRRDRTSFNVRCRGETVVLKKQGHRFLSSLATSAPDSSAVDRLIKKFVAASPKSVALNVLAHVLSPRNSYPHLSAIALSLYTEIAEASWFDWNPKLIADLIALLNKQERYHDSKSLLSLAESRLGLHERELALFHCNLIEANSKHGSSQGFIHSYDRLSEIILSSASVYVKRQGYRSMVRALCEIERPHDAENIIARMKLERIEPSLYEFRSTLYGYGRMGLFEDMRRVLHKMEKEGMQIETVCSNMVLSSYGSHNALTEISTWLCRMKESSIPFSVRTYNSVLNYCPTVVSVLKDLNSCPLSFSELIKLLSMDEVSVVEELVHSPVLKELMEWNEYEVKLDLHGMHLSSAYLIMLQWLDEMKSKLMDTDSASPVEIVVVCGSGRHSCVRGDSPIRAMVKKLMIRTESPMRINRKNLGCFVAKAKAMKKWLS